MMKKQGFRQLLIIGALLCVFFTGCGEKGQSEGKDGSQALEETEERPDDSLTPEEPGKVTDNGPAAGGSDEGTDNGSDRPAEKESEGTASQVESRAECGTTDRGGTGVTEWPRDFEAVKEKLAALPQSGEELKELAGTEVCPVPLYEFGISNNYAGQYVTEPDKDFRALTEAGEAAEILIMQYTVEGDVILDYLNFDGSVLHHVRDCSRDKLAGNGDKYYEYVYDSMWFETRTDEEGGAWEVLYGLLEGDMAVEIFRMPQAAEGYSEMEPDICICTGLPLAEEMTE